MPCSFCDQKEWPSRLLYAQLEVIRLELRQGWKSASLLAGGCCLPKKSAGTGEPQQLRLSIAAAQAGSNLPVLVFLIRFQMVSECVRCFRWSQDWTRNVHRECSDHHFGILWPGGLPACQPCRREPKCFESLPDGSLVTSTWDRITLCRRLGLMKLVRKPQAPCLMSQHLPQKWSRDVQSKYTLHGFHGSYWEVPCSTVTQ